VVNQKKHYIFWVGIIKITFILIHIMFRKLNYKLLKSKIHIFVNHLENVKITQLMLH